MKIDNIRISKAFLECGEDLKLNDHLTVRHPSVGDILTLGNGILCEDVYWSYVIQLLSDPYDHMVWLDDYGIDYESVTSFDVFILKWEFALKEYVENKDLYDMNGITPLDPVNNSLDFFIGHHDFKLFKFDNGTCELRDKNEPSIIINKEVFNSIAAFIKMINGIKQTDRINPANDFAKKILIEDARNELKKKQKKNEENNDYIGDLIAAAIYGGCGGITPFNVKELKIYQLFSNISVDRKKSNYNHIVRAIYNGTVKSDSAKIHDWVSD